MWFTGGTIEVTDPENLKEWKKVFNKSTLPKRRLKEHTHHLGMKIFMGASSTDVMEEDGKLSYILKRPIGGHEKAYIDILYLDETVRIARSKTGNVYVCARVPYFPDE